MIIIINLTLDFIFYFNAESVATLVNKAQEDARLSPRLCLTKVLKCLSPREKDFQ